MRLSPFLMLPLLAIFLFSLSLHIYCIILYIIRSQIKICTTSKLVAKIYKHTLHGCTHVCRYYGNAVTASNFYRTELTPFIFLPLPPRYRDYIVYFPPGYTGTEPLPVVFYFPSFYITSDSAFIMNKLYWLSGMLCSSSY